MCSFIFLPKFTIDSIRQFENEQNIFFLFIGICQKTLHSLKFCLYSNKRNIDDAAKNVNFQSRYANKIENGHQILGTTGLIKLFFSSSYFLCMCCVSSWQFFFSTSLSQQNAQCEIHNFWCFCLQFIQSVHLATHKHIQKPIVYSTLVN